MTDTYTPLKVWTWNMESGGRFANINRPIAGPTHEKELQVGRHPFQDQVGVPVPGQATRRRLQQGAPGLGAPVGLGPSSGPGAECARGHVASHTDMHVCY